MQVFHGKVICTLCGNRYFFRVIQHDIMAVSYTHLPLKTDKEPYEAIVSAEGYSFHILFGSQIGGMFLCIPGWHMGCELSHLNDIDVYKRQIYALGGLVTGTGYFGTLIFGIVKRALIPFGLHHVLSLIHISSIS